MMKEHKKKPREIHYELVPRRDPGRAKVSTCKLLFASVIGIIIIALIAFFLLLLFTIYLRPTPPPSYIPSSDNVSTAVKVPARRPTARSKKILQVFVVYHPGNQDRARDVESYLNTSLLQDENHPLELSLQTLSSSNLSATTLQVTVQDRTSIKAGAIVVFVSELMTPSAAQIEKMIRTEHRTCTKLDVARCAEICSVTTEQSKSIPIMASAPVSFDGISIEVPNLVDVVQDSVIYRQMSASTFSLTRRLRGCVVY